MSNRLSSSGPEPFDACPDGGRCWHYCPAENGSALPADGDKGLPCWRVNNASPFTAYGEVWTAEDKVKHAPSPETSGSISF